MILLVEDDEDVRDMLALTLEGNGFAVTRAENGSVALELLEGQQPCLMILDLVMPDVDGRQVLARMKTRVPTVVISALDGDVPDGAIAALRKPFDREVLLELAARYCSCR